MEALVSAIIKGFWWNLMGSECPGLALGLSSDGESVCALGGTPELSWAALGGSSPSLGPCGEHLPETPGWWWDLWGGWLGLLSLSMRGQLGSSLQGRVTRFKSSFAR